MPNPDRDNCIKLSFPVNAAYVSSARLTASSVANRMNFDIDEIEDIKTAVSEACTYIIKTLSSEAKSNFEISFFLSDESIEINIATEGTLSPAPDDMSLMMIKAMVDDFKISDDKAAIVVNMVKKHKASIFEL